MKIFQSKTGPFSTRPYFTQEEIDSTCIDELSTVGLLPHDPGPIRIDRFIEKRFGRPHSYGELDAGVLGLSLFGSAGLVGIVIASELERDTSRPTERRLRSTLAHEAGHALLHSFLFALNSEPLFGDWSNPQKPRVLCRDERIGTYNGDWWEHQANMVMGAILMPKQLVSVAVEPFLTQTGTLRLSVLDVGDRERVVRQLADLFDVNPALARIRLGSIFPIRPAEQLTL